MYFPFLSHFRQLGFILVRYFYTMAFLSFKRYNNGMIFEYDSEKSKLNKMKHGIDFDEVQVLWNDPERLEIPAKNIDEARYLIIAQMHGKHWSTVFTYRNEKIRLISARRSRIEEVELYESI
jgi:uncharacterized DUF497 family protein